MADFNKTETKIEEEKPKEETKYEEQNLVTYHPPLSPHEPHTWLMILEGKNGCGRHMFYGIKEDHNYVRYVQELKKKEVSCCHGGWLILKAKYATKYTDDYSMLNILTMEKLQLPSLPRIELRYDFAMSSPIMDRSCRLILIPRLYSSVWSWQFGDCEFIERKLRFLIIDHISYKGKLYALTSVLNLVAFDFSNPDLCHEQVISGESLPHFIFFSLFVKLRYYTNKAYLVESRDDILLIHIGSYSHEISYVKVFKADLGTGEWVELETLGDRSIFLGSSNNIFSSLATTSLGMKGNAIYWVRTPFSWLPVALRPSNLRPSERHLYMYDIEDKSISMSLMLPIFGTSLFWGSFNNDEDKMSEQMERVSLIIKEFFYVKRGKARVKSARRLQIEQKKIQKKTEETATIGSSTTARKESLWADLPNELLLEMFPHLFAGDKVAFHSVCRSWYSISLPSRTNQQFVLPLESYDFSSPLLMFPYNKAYNPIHGKLYSMDFPDIPGAKVRATRDGWLLMEYYEYNSTKLYFYNPFTKEEISLPSCDGMYHYYSLFFFAPPTSADCLVVVAAETSFKSVICFKKFEDEGWTCRDIDHVHIYCLMEYIVDAFH